MPLPFQKLLPPFTRAARPSSIVVRAGLFVGVVCLLLIGSTLLNSWNARKSKLSETYSEASNMAKALAQHADDTLRGADTILAGVVDRLETEGNSPEALKRIERFMTRQAGELPQLHGIFVHDREGYTLVNSRGIPRRANNSSDRAYFVHHRDQPDRRALIGAPIRSKSTGEWVITVSRRINQPDGSFGGIAVATISMEYFKRFYDTFDVGRDGLILLWLDDNTLLMRRPFNESLLGRKTRNGLLTQHYRPEQPHGTALLKSPVDGIDRLYGYRHLDQYPLIVAIARSQDEILAGWRTDAMRVLGALLLPLAIIGLLGFRLIRQIQRNDAAEREKEAAGVLIREQASLLDKASDAIIVRGIDNRVHFWNKGAERLYGWEAEEMLGRSTDTKIAREDLIAFRAATATVLAEGEWNGELSMHCKNGASVLIEGHWTLVRDDAGQPKSILAIEADVTQRKAVETEIQKLAFYDSLTGLPNRTLLHNRLQQELAAGERSGHFSALLFIDLDNFKSLNDSLGHHTGDSLLQQVAERLSGCVREQDTVARLGGDEFLIMASEMGSVFAEAVTHARIVGEKILDCFTRPFQIAGHEHFTTPSVGITLFQGKLHDADELLKRADLAMYQAKAAGRNAIRFFDPQMQSTVDARVAIESDLYQALQHDELLLHYQPQMDLDGKLCGVEALLRWRHPGRGMVPPGDFISIAEDTGLIVQIGNWVLRNACKQLARWSGDRHMAELSLAINVSARQFHHPDFLAQVIGALRDSGANPRKLNLELTESLLVDDIEATIVKMDALKALGVRFSLDDFGTGYSSLACLKRLPLDQLKIDQSFVRDLPGDTQGVSIVRTILALGSTLGHNVIAEGVETREQYDSLAREGCLSFQGYLFCKPMPSDQFEAFCAGFAEPDEAAQNRQAHLPLPLE